MQLLQDDRSEERFAAAARSAAGEETRFDDVGCLLAYAHDRGPGALDGSVLVHNHESGDWTSATEAWFVRSGEVSTPMGSGIVAFAERRRAEGFAAAEGAEVRRWEDLLLARDLKPRATEGKPAKAD